MIDESFYEGSYLDEDSDDDLDEESLDYYEDEDD